MVTNTFISSEVRTIGIWCGSRLRVFWYNTKRKTSFKANHLPAATGMSPPMSAYAFSVLTLNLSRVTNFRSFSWHDCKHKHEFFNAPGPTTKLKIIESTI